MHKHHYWGLASLVVGVALGYLVLPRVLGTVAGPVQSVTGA